MDAYIDLVKLAGNGCIPREIPAHYVQWAWVRHRESKKLKAPQLSWRDVRKAVIYL